MLCPFCEHETLIFEDSGVKVAPGLLNELKQYYKKNTNPSIELTFDEITGTQPAQCAPYVWLALMGDRGGCAVDCDFYSTEEAPAKFREFHPFDFLYSCLICAAKVVIKSHLKGKRKWLLHHTGHN